MATQPTARLAILSGQFLPELYPFTEEEHRALNNLRNEIQEIYNRLDQPTEITNPGNVTLSRTISYRDANAISFELDLSDPNLTLEIDPFDPLSESDESVEEIDVGSLIENQSSETGAASSNISDITDLTSELQIIAQFPLRRTIVVQKIEEALFELIRTSNRIKSISFEVMDPYIHQLFFVKQSFPTEIIEHFTRAHDFAREENHPVTFLPGFLTPFRGYSSQRYAPDHLLERLPPISLATRDDIPERFDGASAELTARLRSILILFLEHIPNTTRMSLAYCSNEMSDLEVIEDFRNIDERIRHFVFIKNQLDSPNI